MRGKVARQQRALRRSHENTRLARKSVASERDQHEQEFDREMHELREERAKAIEAASLAFTKAFDTATAERKRAVRSAEDLYIEKRDKIIARLAKEQQAA